jgi:hypothetical protein
VYKAHEKNKSSRQVIQKTLKDLEDQAEKIRAEIERTNKEKVNIAA